VDDLLFPYLKLFSGFFLELNGFLGRLKVNLSIKAVFVSDWFKCDLPVLWENKPLKVNNIVIKTLSVADMNVPSKSGRN
jgi:hypothetical protein